MFLPQSEKMVLYSIMRQANRRVKIIIESDSFSEVSKTDVENAVESVGNVKKYLDNLLKTIDG